MLQISWKSASNSPKSSIFKIIINYQFGPAAKRNYTTILRALRLFGHSGPAPCPDRHPLFCIVLSVEDGKGVLDGAAVLAQAQRLATARSRASVRMLEADESAAKFYCFQEGWLTLISEFLQFRKNFYNFLRISLVFFVFS